MLGAVLATSLPDAEADLSGVKNGTVTVASPLGGQRNEPPAGRTARPVWTEMPEGAGDERMGADRNS